MLKLTMAETVRYRSLEGAVATCVDIIDKRQSYPRYKYDVVNAETHTKMLDVYPEKIASITGLATMTVRKMLLSLNRHLVETQRINQFIVTNPRKK